MGSILGSHYFGKLPNSFEKKYLEHRFQVSRAQGLLLRLERVSGSGSGFLGMGCRVLSLRFGVQGSEFEIWELCMQESGI